MTSVTAISQLFTSATSKRHTRQLQIVSVDTNRIEGAWKHAKDHFKRMSGTNKYKQFEGHRAEVIRKLEHMSRIFLYIYLLRSIYTLRG